MSEYVRLYHEFIAAIADAGAVLQVHGMDSPEFLDADKKATAIYAKLKQMRRDGQD